MAEASGYLKILRSVLDKRKPYVQPAFRVRVWRGDREITDSPRFERYRPAPDEPDAEDPDDHADPSA